MIKSRSIIISLLVMLLFNFTSCTINIYTNTSPINIKIQKHNFDIRFKKIDNQVKIYALGKFKRLIYDSGIIHKNPVLDITVNLSSLIGKGKHKILVELVNDRGNGPNPWEIEYELTRNGAVVDYVHDKSAVRAANPGIVFSQEHNIKIR